MTDRLIVRRRYKIADSLRKIHISENREKITVQKLIYQEVNKFYGSKKMESYVWEILMINSLQKNRQPLSCIVKFLQIVCSSCIHLIMVSCLR
jgi:hypothetical protein